MTLSNILYTSTLENFLCLYLFFRKYTHPFVRFLNIDIKNNRGSVCSRGWDGGQHPSPGIPPIPPYQYHRPQKVILPTDCKGTYCDSTYLTVYTVTVQTIQTMKAQTVIVQTVSVQRATVNTVVMNTVTFQYKVQYRYRI